MNKIFLSILVISFAGISCENNDPPATIVLVKYMSLTPGSTWNYELVTNTPVTNTATFTITSTNRDSTINGKSYHVFTNSSGSANEYSNITGNDYYNFRKLPSALGGSSVEYLYLKDNLSMGASWNQSYPVTVGGFALNATLTNTITEKGISKIVKGITYNDVIHVTTTVAITLLGIPLPSSALTTDIHSYYAAKFGLIQSINIINLNYSGVTENTNQQTNLNTSDIK